ncbi:MAG: hypothetical protein K8S18_18670 [Desulfobacula sp.]|nr:hypothetical protein [Desulfobacula sp.]
MSVLEQLSCNKGTRSEVPNQELAKQLVEKHDLQGINEIAQNLWHKDKKIQASCIKVLYEIGYLQPELIEGFVEDYLQCLTSRNNRLVWSGMIALSTIAHLRPEEIYSKVAMVKKALEKGSVITIDRGMITLANVAAASDKFNTALFPYLLKCLETCRPKSVAQYSESVSIAVNKHNKPLFIKTIEKRKDDLNPPALKRVEKLIKKIKALQD